MIKSRRMRGEKRNAYRILLGKPKGKRTQGRPRYRWLDKNKIDHREIGWGGMDWIDLAGVVWIGLIWLRIRTIGGLLYTWY
jgi:hypothetical protein